MMVDVACVMVTVDDVFSQVKPLTAGSSSNMSCGHFESKSFNQPPVTPDHIILKGGGPKNPKSLVSHRKHKVSFWFCMRVPSSSKVYKYPRLALQNNYCEYIHEQSSVHLDFPNRKTAGAILECCSGIRKTTTTTCKQFPSGHRKWPQMSEITS